MMKGCLNLDPFEEMLNNLLTDVYDGVGKIEEITLYQSKIDASISEVHLIDSVGRSEGATVSDIACDLGITLSSVTVAVNKLSKKGYLIKRKNPNDGRSVNIFLTRSGLRVYRLHRYFHRRMVRAITQDMSQTEKNILYSGLSKLNSFFTLNTRKQEGT